MTTLSEKEALKKSRATSLASLRNLNCWGCGLNDVSVLETAQNLEVLNLSCNQLTSLKDLSHCCNLRELFLRKNQITEFSQLQPLLQLSKLKTLWLSGNPVTVRSDYRTTVIHMLPQLTFLDNTAVTDEERREAENKTSTLQSKSNVLSAVLCLLPVLSQQELTVIHDTTKQMLLN